MSERAAVMNGLRSLSEAANQLGVSIDTLRAWVYRRKIPFVKIGRLVRIRQATIDEIIERGSVPAARETA